jgi:hypothetical protein
MKAEDIEALQALYDAATPGEWKFREHEDQTGERSSCLEAPLYSEENQALIRAMHNALPELIAVARQSLEIKDGKGRYDSFRVKVDQFRKAQAERDRYLVALKSSACDQYAICVDEYGEKYAAAKSEHYAGGIPFRVTRKPDGSLEAEEIV